MFKVTIEEDGLTYAVDFNYEYYTYRALKHSVGLFTITTAYLTDITFNPKWKPEKDACEKAESLCSTEVTFDKNVGRKVALAKLLKNFTNRRKVRKLFWDAYFAARHGKR